MTTAERGAGIVRALTACLLGGVGLMLALSPALQVEFFLPDDTYYYLEIAQRFSLGQGFTFDGINPTNGFQLLWQLVVVVLSWVSGRAGVDVLFLLPLVQAGLLIAAVHVLVRALSDSGIRPLVASVSVLAVVANPFVLKPLFSGMETSLALFVIALYAALGVRVADVHRPLEWPLTFAFTGSAMLLPLTRFDAVMLLPGAVLAYAVGNRRGWWRHVLVGMAGVGCALGLFAAWNQLLFGVPLPVSGMVKSWLSHRGELDVSAMLWGAGGVLALPLHALGLVTRAVVARPVLGVVALFVCMGLVALSRQFRFDSRVFGEVSGRWLFFAVGIVFHLSFYVFYLPKYASLFWYYAPEFAFIAVALGVIAQALSVRPRLLKPAVALAAAVTVLVYALVYVGYTFEAGRKARFRLVPEVAEWIDTNLPSGALVGSWNSGAIGFFASRDVVNLDGLVNSPVFYREYLRRERLGDYLIDSEIEYLVDYSPTTDFRAVNGVQLEVVHAIPYTMDSTSLFERGGSRHDEYFVVARVVGRAVE